MEMARIPLLVLLFFMRQSSADPHCFWSSDDGRCIDCHMGWYGDYCNYKCPGNCDIGGCHRDTGICIQCNAGYHGINCTVTCPANCRYSHGDKPYCSRETGHCQENCLEGWWGKKCENRCSDRCINNSCYFWDGSCARGCRDSWAGDSCDTRCPGGCHGDTCERYGSHKCTQGCKHGVHGHHCDKQCNRHCRHQDCFYDHGMKSTVCRQGCVDGWMSLDCKMKCPGNCEACSQETGECSRCKPGYWGSDCTRPCSDTCANKTCDRGGGRCSGCIPGYYGNTCDTGCGADCMRCLQVDDGCGCREECHTMCLQHHQRGGACEDVDGGGEYKTNGSQRREAEDILFTLSVGLLVRHGFLQALNLI
ncbi:scavenger receptor class F member 1-like isoform X1 [Haliotis rubra]|uniref:scavenger receptor class F member 1-like isoform X1 n=1 Tax=Haliotis rubra TaxID=36100 RepID=UPI001EE59575|nr:scavenger receptor class F member 1-like isoform X1 [Haliotis rubra]